MIFVLITQGCNPYRFTALNYMLFYSFFFSLPCLIFLIDNYAIFTFYLKLKNFTLSYSSFWFFCIFFAKTPLYLFHFWLPKAHVEASTLGSILLAAILLKMGTFGVLKILLWRRWNILCNISYVLITGSFILLHCLTQSDVKKLIALTSVFHINMRLFRLFTYTEAGLKTFYLINLRHTITRAIFFFLAGVITKFNNWHLTTGFRVGRDIK